MDSRFTFAQLPEYDNHELVLRFFDTATGLKGFIAIHTTTPGPAVGGTRFSYYPHEEEALKDALRLSRAMTYKCALANVPYGGGKAVLMAPRAPSDARTLKTKKYLAAYARVVDLLNGHFFTGEDVGMTKEDIVALARASSHIIGRPGVGGLPAYWAALSVFESMRAALQVVRGSDSFAGRTVAIKGLGNAGFDLAQMVTRAGGRVIGAEINPERVERARKRIPSLRIVSPKVIHRQVADIFSPCALGGDLSLKTIPQLKAQIVCGAANNQLASPQDAARLLKRSITYVPDYIANGGGLINVVDELHTGGYSRPRVEKNVAGVYTTVLELLATAGRKHASPSDVADAIAQKRFTKKRIHE